MTTAIVRSKGRITIPATVRNDLKVGAGDRIEFIRIGPGCYELVAATSDVRVLKGMFGPAVERVSIEEMNRTIAAGGTRVR